MLSDQRLLPASVARRQLPKNLRLGDLPLFQAELERHIPPTELRILRDATVGPEGMIWEGPRLVRESLPSYGRSLRRGVMPLAATMKRRPQSNRDRYEEALWITDYWSNEYFHWITDALPRLLVARDFVAGRDLLLPNRFQQLTFLEPSLRPFGVDRIAFIPRRQVVRCERLLMPTSTAPTGNYNESLIREMRQLFVRQFVDSSNRDSPVGSNKVYISRRRASRRRIANEDEISGVLKELGFAVVCMEDFAFERQVRILACAKYLVSNHGAGLTNMLFMPPGGRVLELRRVGDSHNNCFFALASALDLEYFYQLCPSGRHRLNARSRDLIVEVPALRQTLTAMLDRKSVG